MTKRVESLNFLHEAVELSHPGQSMFVYVASARSKRFGNVPT
jgi:hypothetical protein